MGEADAQARALAVGPPPPPLAGEGRGIVICAGGARLLTGAWVTLALLRRTLGCTLPVEVWHLGPRELGPHEAALFAELGDVAIVDAQEVRREHPARTLGGWELKPYAVAHSRFAEVLLLDADNVPVRDPAFLFELPAYREAGALFWPDVERLEEGNPAWEQAGVPYRNEPAWETGQLVVDRARQAEALERTLAMNMESERWYPHTKGDKDTWHLAWRALGAPVAMTRYPPRGVASGLIQRDLEGAPLFQHRTLAKWVLHGENLVDPDFRLHDECVAHLADLRGRWTGRVEPATPDVGGPAATRWFAFERAGHPRRELELLPAGRVGVGRTERELRWRVDGEELVFEGAAGETARLRGEDGGAWRSAAGALLPLDAEDAGPLGPAVALLVRRALAGLLDRERALDALGALAEGDDIAAALARARRAHAGDAGSTAFLDAAERRVGVTDPSLFPHGREPGATTSPAGDPPATAPSTGDGRG